VNGWEDHAVALANVAVIPTDPPPRPDQPDESLPQLLARVGRSLGVEWEDLKGASRRKYICRARAIAAAEAQVAGYSSPEIGRALGGRHHSTILHAIASLAPLHDGGETPG
jgi:chromosomal replication initiation ATPase DnaA